MRCNFGRCLVCSSCSAFRSDDSNETCNCTHLKHQHGLHSVEYLGKHHVFEQTCISLAQNNATLAFANEIVVNLMKFVETGESTDLVQACSLLPKYLEFPERIVPLSLPMVLAIEVGKRCTEMDQTMTCMVEQMISLFLVEDTYKLRRIC